MLDSAGDRLYHCGIAAVIGARTVSEKSSFYSLIFRDMWRWRFAVPPEKGAWVWWIGPLIIGVGAARHIPVDFWILLTAAFAGFMIKQPLTLVVKVLSGRRGAPDWGPGVAWSSAYTMVLVVVSALLAARGHARVLLTGIAGVPLFAWHLWLVSRGEERRQIVVDILAAGVLALTAPAAYLTCGGADPFTPWTLWLLTWLQSSASIVHAFLRLDQRRLKGLPSLDERWRSGIPATLHHIINVVVATALTAAGVAPRWTPLAFVIPLLDGIEGVARPPVGVKPGQIGMRQLAVTSAFVMMMLAAYLIG